MIASKDDIPRMQSDFYRNWYHKILRALVISAFIMLFLILAIIYNVIFKPVQKYYATTTEGQIIRILPK